jgi:hypothetical protein
MIDFFWGCFNVTFSNISAISWRPVLVVEEAGVPGEKHRPWASNWSTVSLLLQQAIINNRSSRDVHVVNSTTTGASSGAGSD